MVSYSPLAHWMLFSHRSVLKIWPSRVRFHKPSCEAAVRLFSSVRSSDFSLHLQRIQAPCGISRLSVSNTQNISLLLEGRVVFKKPALIFSSSMQRSFSSSLQTLLDQEETETTRQGGTTHLSGSGSGSGSGSPWLMVPPSLVADSEGGYKRKRDATYCCHCRSAVLGSVGTTLIPTKFKVKRKSEVEPEDNDYYHFLNAAANKVLKKKKNLWMPWQTDHLSPDEAICIGSSHGWLAFIHPRNCSLYLYNPFIDSSMPYLPLPPIETLPPLISSRRLNGMHVDSSSSSSHVVTEFMIWKQISPISAKDLSENFFRKLVMSSAPTPFVSNNKSNVDQDSQCCTVMAIQGKEHPNRLAFCRIGDTSWTALDSPITDSYADLLYFSKNKLFYALCNHGSVESWDLTNPSSPKRSLAISTVPPTVQPTMDDRQRKVRICSHPTMYLAESSGELLMVLRYQLDHPDDKENIMTAAFDVYKRDFVENKWVYVPSLGDRVLFIGQNHSVSVSAHDFPGLRRNSIYFTAEYIEDSWGCYDLGVFNLEDESLYLFDLKEIQPSPIWVLPQL